MSIDLIDVYFGDYKSPTPASGLQIPMNEEMSIQDIFFHLSIFNFHLSINRNGACTPAQFSDFRLQISDFTAV